MPPARAQLETLIHRVKQGISPVELVHIPHDRWPYPRDALPANSSLRISVLDSSFNPPTRAHPALASLPAGHDKSTAATDQDFDAKLLLLSVRNVDKALKSTDASYVQRLEMMMRLTEDVVPASTVNAKPVPNVAVAIIDEPTFVGKAKVLNEIITQRIASLPKVSSTGLVATTQDVSMRAMELTFLVGMDTLERILAPRYYSSPPDMHTSLRNFMTTSRLICARRILPGQLTAADEKEEEVLSLAQEYLDMERLELVSLKDDFETFSSSEVRSRVDAKDEQLWMKMVTPGIAAYIAREGLYKNT